jgi:chromosome partitioning protein
VKVVAIAAAKGGAGKSTVATSVAARASKDVRVGMIDLNVDQATLSQWWVDRGEPGNPALITDISDLASDVDMLREQATFDWIVIDTPPLEMGLIEASIMVADVVIVPARTSMFDLDAIEPIADLCDKHRTPCRFMLSAVDPRFKKLTQEATGYIADMASACKFGEVSSAHTSYKAAYMNAPTNGRSAAEIDKSIVPETDQLWSEIQAAAEA